MITYMLLCGRSPFYGDTDHTLGFFTFTTPEWDDASSAAKDFISCLLRTDPSKRLTAGEGLAHPWIACNSNTRKVERCSSCNAKHSLVSVPCIVA